MSKDKSKENTKIDRQNLVKLIDEVQSVKTSREQMLQDAKDALKFLRRHEVMDLDEILGLSGLE